MTHKKLELAFPLSKTMDPQEDLPILAEGLKVVEATNATEGQHPLRAWEYAMAHRAIREWENAGVQALIDQEPGARNFAGAALQLCDVGGAGSGFWKVLASLTSERVLLIDPNATGSPDLDHCINHVDTIEEYVIGHPHNQFDALTCLSVIEHVAELPKFLRACHMLLKPGGLFFLTCDTWNCDGPDTAELHWMRERIYNPDSIRRLTAQMREIGFQSFGRSDWAYHGNHVYDFTFASIAMTRKV